MIKTFGVETACLKNTGVYLRMNLIKIMVVFFKDKSHDTAQKLLFEFVAILNICISYNILFIKVHLIEQGNIQTVFSSNS